MITAQKLNIFLHKKQDYHIDAVQGETGRGVQMRIWSGDVLWRAGASTRIQIRYQRSDGTGGIYDTLPDGTPAWSFEDDTLTVLLAPQVLSFNGEVSMQVVIGEDAQEVSTFTIIIDVQDDLSAGAITGEDRISLNGWIEDAVADQLDLGQQRWMGMYGLIDGGFVLGDLDDGDGTELVSDRHIRTGLIGHGGRRVCISIPPQVQAKVCYYDAQHQLLSTHGAIETSALLAPVGTYFRLVAAYQDGRTISKVEDMTDRIVLFYPSDQNDAYRGNIVQRGYTRLADCTECGYYSIALGDQTLITDLPKGIRESILEVLPTSSAAKPLQRLITSTGDIWVKRDDGFVQVASKWHKPLIFSIYPMDGSEEYSARTTLNEIQDAVEGGQAVICQWGERWLPMVMVANSIAYFSAVVDDQILRVETDGQTARVYTDPLVTYPIKADGLAEDVLIYENIGSGKQREILCSTADIGGYFGGTEATQQRTYIPIVETFTLEVVDATGENEGFSADLPQQKLDCSEVLFIEFDLLAASGQVDVHLIGANGDGEAVCPLVQSLYADKVGTHVRIEVDLPQQMADHDMVLLQKIGMDIPMAQNGASFTIRKLRIHQNRSTGTKYHRSRLDDHLRALDQAVQQAQESAVTAENLLISPSGKRFVSGISDAGVLRAVPVVPSDMMFIGNSMLMGFGTFGAAAQDSEHDYYHYITDYLTGTLGGTLTAQRLVATAWEIQTDPASAAAWVQTNVQPRLNMGTQLVLIQLSENVSSDAMLACFAQSCVEMIRLIRQSAQKARVAWVGPWDRSQVKRDIIRAACAQAGALFIDISDLSVTANTNAVGNTYINSSGVETVINNPSMAALPNSRGMLAIANRILCRLSITDSETTIADPTLDM